MEFEQKSNKAIRTALWMAVDVVLLNLAMVLAQMLRYTTNISYEFFGTYFRLIPALSLIGLISFSLCGMYRTMWQYSSAEDLFRILVAVLATSLLTLIFSLIANTFVQPQNLYRLHRMVYLLFWMTGVMLVGVSRLVYRFFATGERFSFLHRNKSNVRRAMVLGAGWLGANVVHEMQRGNYGACVPVVVVDDDKSRTGSSLAGVPVVRGTGNILKLTSDYAIDDIIIAISTPQNDLNQALCGASGFVLGVNGQSNCAFGRVNVPPPPSGRRSRPTRRMP